MASSSMYQMHGEYDQVEFKGQRAEAAHGTAARCLPNSAHGKATAILYVLYVLLALGFALFTALFMVKFGKLSKEQTGFRLGIQETRADHRKDASDLQDSTDIRNLTHAVWRELGEMRQNHYRLQKALSTVQEELQSITELICTKCPLGWQQFEKKCYFFSPSRRTWSDAKQFCANKRSHLPIINTEQEQAFLSNIVISNRVYWLGLSDSEEEGQWQWLDGSPLSVTFWAQGEPNDSADGEDCGTLHTDRMWNDLRCSNSEFWICERPC